MVTWDGGSNRQPFECLSRGLLDRDADVHVLSHEAHRALYEDLGATFHVLPLGEKEPGSRPSAAAERERVMDLWLSPKVAEAVAECLREAPSDVAIVDASLLTAFAACEVTATPYVVVHHSLPGSAWSGPRRDQFAALVEPVNEVRRGLGLDVASDFGALMSRAAAHIVPTAAELDGPVPWRLPMHYVGPLQPSGDPGAQIPDLPKRFVLVSFSTTWQRQVEVLQRTIDALAPLDHAVVVTTGPSVDPSELVPAGNTVVAAEVPHASVLHRAEVVVTHAGHGTVVSALTAGVPLVCIPMGRDQHDVTRRVVALGAGLAVGADDTASDLLQAVQSVLGERRFADHAAAVARSIAAHGGLGAALSIIDRCAEERHR
ncbi:MAG TPA: nucleotide disphospho-sugar-binding domain-containing protein [Acidimicrobiales bacterium]|nr:nucleotide disphospho-sugar-binding domain-containing protein [Acidimicrobiales bacterium]